MIFLKVEIIEAEIFLENQFKPCPRKDHHFMLEKPDLQDDIIISCLLNEYGLANACVHFLPLGADVNTAVYRVVVGEGAAYFLKLRRGHFDEISVVLPEFLSDRGITQVIAPLSTRSGRLWADLYDYKTILYPFVEGHDGYAVGLSDTQWSDLGKVLKNIHTTHIPAELTAHIRRETYSPSWREMVKKYLSCPGEADRHDLAAQKAALFLSRKQYEVLNLIERADLLAQKLQVRPPHFVLCHADLHAGNILITASGDFYIVDWDDPILAPKERDLMFVGGGLFGNRRTPQQEEALFYLGYGQPPIDLIALSYYRYERIIQDIAVECEQIFMADAGDSDREQALLYLQANFLPNNTIEIACKSDKS
jgi:spectinomycin phosphotransferase